MAGAYTVFANSGVHLNPWMLASVRNTNGDIVSDFSPEAKQVLDPARRLPHPVAARRRHELRHRRRCPQHGFTAPAAGKTGTSHDAWFAGYTSNLICIVWVGNDDYTDIKIEGAHAAAPIWAEFMKRAIQLPQYSDVKPFTPPEGVTTARIDKTSSLLVDSTCPNNSFYVAFLDGTAPVTPAARWARIRKTSFRRSSASAATNPPHPTPRRRHPQPALQSFAHAPNTPPDGNAPDTTRPAATQRRKTSSKRSSAAAKTRQTAAARTTTAHRNKTRHTFCIISFIRTVSSSLTPISIAEPDASYDSRAVVAPIPTHGWHSGHQ